VAEGIREGKPPVPEAGSPADNRIRGEHRATGTREAAASSSPGVDTAVAAAGPAAVEVVTVLAAAVVARAPPAVARSAAVPVQREASRSPVPLRPAVPREVLPDARLLAAVRVRWNQRRDGSAAPPHPDPSDRVPLPVAATSGRRALSMVLPAVEGWSPAVELLAPPPLPAEPEDRRTGGRSEFRAVLPAAEVPARQRWGAQGARKVPRVPAAGWAAPAAGRRGAPPSQAKEVLPPGRPHPFSLLFSWPGARAGTLALPRLPCRSLLVGGRQVIRRAPAGKTRSLLQ
jgi:hypothetical protein